jgi:hypothetical protein
MSKKPCVLSDWVDHSAASPCLQLSAEEQQSLQCLMHCMERCLKSCLIASKRAINAARSF